VRDRNIIKINSSGTSATAYFTDLLFSNGVQVDSSGNIYVGGPYVGGNIYKYNSSGTLISTIPCFLFNRGNLAFDTTLTNLYCTSYYLALRYNISSPATTYLYKFTGSGSIRY
jgi:hypothetical protein